MYAARESIWLDLGIVIPELKLVFSAVPRTGNTSVKIALARQLGSSDDRFMGSKWSHATWSAGVHNAELAPWASIRTYGLEATLEQVRHRQWLWFSSVREPLERLFSSWFTYILAEDPHLASIGVKADYPSIPTSIEEIPVLFEKFVMSPQLDRLMACDVHFAPMTSLLPPHQQFPYVQFFRNSNTDEMTSQINSHLLQFGRHLVTEIPNVNEGALHYADFDWRPSEVVDRCLKLFRDDYRAFGFDRPCLPDSNHADLARSIPKLIDGLRARNRRIAALSKMLQ